METKSSVSAQADLRTFYEQDYARSNALTPLLQADDFMYGQVLAQIRAYLKPQMKALDLGCNDGALSLYMARQGCDVLGIDLARNAVELAARSGRAHGIANARFAALDFAKDWTEPAQFDLILCSHVIEHIPDDGAFVRQMHRALKPQGRLVLLTPAAYSSLARLSKLLTGRFAHDEAVGHLRRYTRGTAEELIRRAGFTIDRTVFLDGMLRDWFILCRPLRKLNRLWALPVVRRAFNAFDAFTARFAFAATLCVHATKQDGSADQ